MPDMNENAETQQEYFGKVRTDNTDVIANACRKITELEDKLANADYQLEGRDLEIKELQAQIEKMKCCDNCIYQTYDYEDRFCSNQKHCKNYNLWELRR